MLPAQRHASRCIYCAFRSQQLALRARRLRSTAPTAPTAPAGSHGPNILFHAGPDRSERRQRARRDAAPSPAPVSRRVFRVHESRPRSKFGWAKGKENFNDALHKRLEALKEELSNAPLLQHLSQVAEQEDEKTDKFDKLWKNFRRDILQNDELDALPWSKHTRDDESKRKTHLDLMHAFRSRGVPGLDERIKYAFYAHVTGTRFTKSDIRNQKALADLRYPTEWFPSTRLLHRTVHLHVGPTNSGKTYQALQRLEQAKSGLYAGPLRLLAHEVYSRMNAKGRRCGLITGEERRIPDGTNAAAGDPDLVACTVEMVPVNKTVEVAVIDEIQMISNSERGWAWTQALMGVKAKEVHLCGEERTVPLIQELCASVGDKLEVHKYERLSPLKMADQSLDGDLSKLRKGDCIVSFSVIGIHALRKQIERQTGRKVATVYGSLPPETRAQQARLFNDPDNEYDFLVASDAVGMGLNLAIKRIIFETSSKFDGISRRSLSIADIKQIAGRAGRYRTAAFNAKTLPPPENSDKNENVGLVTTLEPFDYPIVAAAMSSQPEPIRTAGLFPPSSVLDRFASYFPPRTPFSYILVRLHELSQTHGRFHLCGLRDQIWLADLIEPVKGLTIADRNVICNAPASRSEDMWRTLMPAYARCIAEQSGGDIVDIPELPLEILELPVSASREYLRELEKLHKGIVTYLWLSYRFAGIFGTRGLAFYVKGLVEEKIEEVLGKFSFSEAERRKVAARREKEILRGLAKGEEAAGEHEGREGERVGVEEEEDGEKGVMVEGEEDEVDEVEREGADGEMDGSVGILGELEDGNQGSSMAGGERFADEEDVVVEDPEDKAGVVEDEKERSTSTSFTQWRQEQTRETEQARTELEENHLPSLKAVAESEVEASLETEEAGADVETVSAERPSIAAALPEEAGTADEEKSAIGRSPPDDASDDDQHQQARATRPRASTPPPSKNDRPLAHIDVNATTAREAESHVGTRP